MNTSIKSLLDSLAEQVSAAQPLGRAPKQKLIAPPSVGHAEPFGRPLGAQAAFTANSIDRKTGG